jgi:hypothetical protein
MKLKELREDAWSKAPPRMVELVRFLNQIVGADPEAVTKLLDTYVASVNEDALDKVAPHAIVREGGFLSGLGLLSAYVNTADYRIFAAFENDDEPYGNITKFGIYEVTEETKA